MDKQILGYMTLGVLGYALCYYALPSTLARRLGDVLGAVLYCCFLAGVVASTVGLLWILLPGPFLPFLLVAATAAQPLRSLRRP